MALERFEHESFEIDMDNSSDDVKAWSGESNFAPPEVPPGEYRLNVAACKQDTSKRGNTMVVVDFEVADGEFAGKFVRNYYTLTEKARGRIKALQIACGARLDKIRADELVGTTILATVIHEEMPPQVGPDGQAKVNPATGEPYPPSISAKVLRERPTPEAEEAAAKAAQQPKPAAAPPVTRGKANSSPSATRRA